MSARAGSATRARALLAGAPALAALASAPAGEVLAAFATSAYVRMGGQALACIGGADLPPGPLNVRCDRFDPMPVGTAVRLQGACLRFADGSALELAPARAWAPPPCPAPRAATWAQRVRALERSALLLSPHDGLCRSVLGEAAQGALARHAAPALRALDDWLAIGGVSPPPDAVAALLGLGPGLTPSGDDLLAGVLVACAAWGRRAVAGALWSALEPRLDVATGLVSAAHLRAASEGAAAAPVHACMIAAVDESVVPRRAFAALDAFGHTSGWDALAGVLLVARAIAR